MSTHDNTLTSELIISTPSALIQCLQLTIAAGQVPMIHGDPGIGKSSIIKAVADSCGMWVQDLRISQLSDVDLRGLPHIDSNGCSSWARPDFWPTAEQGPCLLFLDEINRGLPSTMNAALQLVLDRRVGNHVLPDDCAVVAAGNLSHSAGTQTMGDAINNRMVHFLLQADLDDWSAWAVSPAADIHPMVLAFLRFRPELLHVFSAKTKAKAYPTPRSWEFVSRICHQLNGQSVPAGVEMAMYSGAVGQGAAIEFAAFVRLYRNLPSIDGILLDPAHSPIPQQSQELYAVSAAIARKVTVDDKGQSNFPNALVYLDRLPEEYCIFAVRDARRRLDKKLTSLPAFSKWAVQHMEVLS